SSYFIFDLQAILNFEYLKSSRELFLAYYSQNTFFVIFVFFLVYVLMTAFSFPGAAIMTLAAGMIFGFILGTIIVSFASSIGAVFAAIFSRYMFREALEKKFSKKLKIVNKKVEEEGAFYLFSLRLIPIFPFFLINILFGLTKMKLWTFFWVSQIGMLLGTMIYVNAGSQIGKIDSVSGILSPSLILSFVLIGLFPLLIKKGMEFWKKRKIVK
ncbi:MAG: TVP38/TMEM64 family protein, partial [Nanoarchaeota archaeon]|nr:TVP38/TMEM64 family protein [Nanoarchaeota archaeon]